MPAPKGNTYAAGGPGGGRPSAYKQEYAKIAKSLCLLGATDKQMADAFGVSETTINNWKHQHEEFSCALKEGKLFADANVAHSVNHLSSCCGAAGSGIQWVGLHTIST